VHLPTRVRSWTGMFAIITSRKRFEWLDSRRRKWRYREKVYSSASFAAAVFSPFHFFAFLALSHFISHNQLSFILGIGTGARDVDVTAHRRMRKSLEHTSTPGSPCHNRRLNPRPRPRPSGSVSHFPGTRAPASASGIGRARPRAPGARSRAQSGRLRMHMHVNVNLLP